MEPLASWCLDRLAATQAAARRIRRADMPAHKTTEITVFCKTGERRINVAAYVPTPPKEQRLPVIRRPQHGVVTYAAPGTPLGKTGNKPPAPLDRAAVKQILDTVAKVFEVSRGDILGHSRHPFAAWPRQAAMVLVRKLLHGSLHQTSGIFGRDHSTLLHSMEKVRERADSRDPRHVRFMMNYHKAERLCRAAFEGGA